MPNKLRLMVRLRKGILLETTSYRWSEVLIHQKHRQWQMLRATINRFSDEEWRQGTKSMMSPAQVAFHLLQWADYYCRDSPNGFDKKARFGVEANDDVEKLPGRADLLNYVDAVEASTAAFLRSLDDTALLQPETICKWTGSTVLDRILYALRHTTYHLGELSYILRINGAETTEWK